jgi:hypothetical protein
MRGAQWGELRVLRDLQKEVIGEAVSDSEAIP